MANRKLVIDFLSKALLAMDSQRNPLQDKIAAQASHLRRSHRNKKLLLGDVSVRPCIVA